MEIISSEYPGGTPATIPSAANGVINTGGGGGGGTYQSSGASGGSGVILIAYPS
jgi:hypothetical protein